MTFPAEFEIIRIDFFLVLILTIAFLKNPFLNKTFVESFKNLVKIRCRRKECQTINSNL
jgi:hypothetical protein